MIVQPDFCDHWKTRHVVKGSGSEAAVRAILRLWGHCQQRRRWVFPDLTPVMLAAICGWEGESQVFWDAMVGMFIDATPAGFEVHEWAEVNASLLAGWEKGKFGALGGRPKKNPQGNPGANPGKSLGKPDKRREEKIGEEISEAKASSSAAGAADASGAVPFMQVIDAFHRLCPSHPKLRDMTDERRKAIRSRWKAMLKACSDPMTRFEELFRLAEESDFLAGRKSHPAFGFDWLLKSANAQKVIEGNYRNGTHPSAQKRHYKN